MPVSADIKEMIGKLASITGKNEGEIFLQCIGIKKVDENLLRQNLAKMKISALASYLDIDADDIQKIIDAKTQSKA